MAKWRPVDIRVWSDRKFLALGDDGRMLWLFLLTTSFMLPIPGVIVAGEAAMAEQLGWTVERLREGFQELFDRELSVRREGRLTWLTKAFDYQKIAGPNTIEACRKVWDDIPSGPLKADIWHALRAACKSWNILFSKGFPKPIEGFQKPLGKEFDTVTVARTTTTSGTRTRTRTTSPEDAGASSFARAAPPVLSGDPRGVEHARLLRVLVPEHVKAFNRVRDALRAKVPAMQHVGDPAALALSALLHEQPSLAEFEDIARHVIAVREAEAMATKSVKFFGASVWKSASFAFARTLSVEEASQGSKQAKTSVFEIGDQVLAELEREAAETNPT